MLIEGLQKRKNNQSDLGHFFNQQIHAQITYHFVDSILCIQLITCQCYYVIAKGLCSLFNTAGLNHLYIYTNLFK